MNKKILLALVLSGIFISGCAQKTHHVLQPMNKLQTRNNVILKPYNKIEDKLFFNIVVEKQIESAVSSEMKNPKIENLFTYVGEIDINKYKEKNVDFIYKKVVKTPYIASKMIDKNGKTEELESDVLTGLSFDVIEKEADKNNYKEKVLVLKLNEAVDWKTVYVKNAYGVDEPIVSPTMVSMNEMITLPVKFFEMTRFFNNTNKTNDKITVKVYINKDNKFLPQ